MHADCNNALLSLINQQVRPNSLFFLGLVLPQEVITVMQIFCQAITVGINKNKYTWDVRDGLSVAKLDTFI